MYLLAGSLLEHAAQLVGDLLVLRSVLAGVHGVARLVAVNFAGLAIRDVFSRIPSCQPSARPYQGPCRGSPHHPGCLGCCS